MYVGCPTGSVPPKLLSDQDLHPLELKELLKNIPTKEGVLQANSEETVVRLLLNMDVFPIRIKRLSKNDIKLFNLRKMQRKLSSNNSNRIIIMPKKKSKKLLPILISIVVIIGVYYIYSHML